MGGEVEEGWARRGGQGRGQTSGPRARSCQRLQAGTLPRRDADASGSGLGRARRTHGGDEVVEEERRWLSRTAIASPFAMVGRSPSPLLTRIATATGALVCAHSARRQCADQRSGACARTCERARARVLMCTPHPCPRRERAPPSTSLAANGRVDRSASARPGRRPRPSESSARTAMPSATRTFPWHVRHLVAASRIGPRAIQPGGAPGAAASGRAPPASAHPRTGVRSPPTRRQHGLAGSSHLAGGGRVMRSPAEPGGAKQEARNPPRETS